MDDYLAKPVGLDSLRAVLKRWLPDKPEKTAKPTVAVRRRSPSRRREDLPAIDPERARSLGRERRRRAAQHPAAVQRDGLGLLARHRAGDGLRRPRDPAVGRPPAAQRRPGGRRAARSAAPRQRSRRAAKTGDRVACEGEFGHLVVEMDRVRGQIERLTSSRPPSNSLAKPLKYSNIFASAPLGPGQSCEGWIGAHTSSLSKMRRRAASY